MTTSPAPRCGDGLGELGVGEAGVIVHEVGAGGERGRRDLGPVGVDGDRDVDPRPQLAHDGHNAVDLGGDRDRVARLGRHAADVEQIGARGDHLEAACRPRPRGRR